MHPSDGGEWFVSETRFGPLVHARLRPGQGNSGKLATLVRDHARIPDDQVIMICVAMGWPDAHFPANAVVSNRKGIDEAVRFVGFND